jgi:type I restriction enzyme M protein
VRLAAVKELLTDFDLTMESFEAHFKVIWDAMNDRVPSDSSRFKCLLFILHLYQNRTFREKLAGTDGRTCFAERLERAVQDTVQADGTGQSGYLKEVFDAYKKKYFDGCQADPCVWDRFLEAVSSVPDEWYAEYYKEVFETILQRIAEEEKDYSSIIQPTAVTWLVAELLGYEGKGRVYNPYAGLASYAIEMNTLSDYHGEEINPETRALGMLRLAAHGINPESLSVKNSYMQGFDGDCKYDYIVATPPFSGLIRKGDEGFDSHVYHTFYRDFLFRGSQMLSTNGKLAGAFPLSFIYSEQTEPKNLRQYLVNEHIVSTVILLPNAIFFNTSFPTVVVALDAARKGKGIKFIDASTLYEKVRHRSVLELDKIKEAIGCEDGIHTKVVSYEYVANQGGYSLYPSMYIDEEENLPKGYIAVKASDVLMRIKPKLKVGTQCTRGHMLTFKVLSDVPLAGPLSAENLPEQDISDSVLSISRSCAFIKTVGSLRPTYVSVENGETLYFEQNLAVFEVDTTKVYAPLFLYEWSRKVNKLVIGSAKQTVNLHGGGDEFRLEVFLPETLSEQEALYERMLREYKDARAKEIGLEELIASQRRDFIYIFRSRKHDLGNRFGAIRNNVAALSDFLSNQGLMDKLVNTNAQRTVGQQMDRLNQLLVGMGEQIKHLVDETAFGEPQKVDLVERLNAITSDGSYKLEYTEDFDMMLQHGEHAFVNINRLDLDRVFDNIIGNAVKHGFKGETGHKVVIDLSYDAKDRKYIVAFKNDGRPMPDGFDSVRYGTVGDKSADSDGSGQGGAIVKGIVEHFGGSYEVINNPGAIFKVEILIKLPIYDER